MAKDNDNKKEDLTKQAVKIQKVKISDLIQDDKNANKGTEVGAKAIEHSIETNKLGRSILLDKNNNIIAGNKTTTNAEKQGYEDVIIVETTGNQLVAVKRMDIDLDSPEGRELALADNRTSELNLDWDKDVLQNVFSNETLKKYGMELTKLKVNVSEPVYPIVPKYDEKYHAIVIVSKTETDFVFLQTLLELSKHKSYKNTKVGTTQVIDVDHFRKIWEQK